MKQWLLKSIKSKLSKWITITKPVVILPNTSAKSVCDSIKERVHSEMKISDKVKLNSNILTFAFFFYRSVSFSSYINSGHTISLPGPASSPPGTCIITTENLHFHLRDLHYRFLDLHYCFWSCIFTSGTCIITSLTCIIASEPVFLYRNLSVQKIKTNGRKLP